MRRPFPSQDLDLLDPFLLLDEMGPVTYTPGKAVGAPDHPHRGSRLVIGDEVVIDHDGFHGATERAGAIALAAGFHPLSIDFFHAGGAKALHLTARRAGDDRPSSVAPWLFHR